MTQMTKARNDNETTLPPYLRKEVLTPAQHQEQYDEDAASFFHCLNKFTGRPELYYGHLSGKVSRNQSDPNKNRIAIDWGCGTGWLTPRLLDFGFSRVYGIDSSPFMLKKAFKKTAKELIKSSQVCYSPEIPKPIIGQCSLITAIHMHYHFQPLKELQEKFFNVISNTLEPNGEAIIIGCPSDHISDTPPHYQNSIHIDNIPRNILNVASSHHVLTDDEGFILLSDLPEFTLKDGMPMKVRFTSNDLYGKIRHFELTDTYWSDKTLIETAGKAGLKLISNQKLSWSSYPNAYMSLHFRKSNNSKISCIPN